MPDLPFAATTPVHVSRVGLRARDAERLAGFYREIVGLTELSRTQSAITLGAGTRALLDIEADPSAEPDDPRSAGLFHTAFLLPGRADLARWVRHAADTRLRIEGASDHLVSEAIYLSDPEGNGIEIYADRAPEAWPREGDQIAMATLPLDLRGLVETLPAGQTDWRGAPDGTVVGHVHLRVGDPRTAEEWWTTQMGFETMARYGKAAVFLASGGYHHHIGANVWQSAGAGPRDPRRAGLGWVELASSDIAAGREAADPWGTVIRTVPKA